MPAPKQTTIAPVTGVLDLRSAPEQLPPDALRMRQNFQCVGQGKLRRGSGFSKLLSTGNYNNADFHDQMLVVSTTTPVSSIRQPITLLAEAVSTLGERSLFLATQSTIAQLNSHSGAWRIMGSGFGGTASTSGKAPRFKAARLGDYMVFTNDFDRPKYARLGQGADPITGELLFEIPDLVTIGLRRAKVVWSWRNVLFFADVEMDNERIPYRLLWSDLDNPLGFDPADVQSITGSKDLDTAERILAGGPLGDSFLIYTTRGIWEMIAVGGDVGFDFRRVYNADKETLKGVLAYPNTLCLSHEAHWYLGKDGAYSFNLYQGVPDRNEWLHRSTSNLLDNIDASVCDAHVGIILGDEILFSVARQGAVNQLPDYTLRANKAYQVADVVDHAFTAFAQYTPEDVPTIRDFILENNICTEQGLADAGYGYTVEGVPREPTPGDAPYTPLYFYTDKTQTIDDGKGGTITVEDWNQPAPSSDSLCNLLGGMILDEICRTCDGTPLLIAASSVDWCIKSLGGVFYREMCLNAQAAGSNNTDGFLASVGSYSLDPITSILRFGPAYVKDSRIRMEELVFNFAPEPQVDPLGVCLRIGVSAQQSDPNTGRGMVWHQHSCVPLKYETDSTEQQHLTNNTEPTERAHWHFYRIGRFLYVELSIAGVGGDALMTGIDATIKPEGQTYNF